MPRWCSKAGKLVVWQLVSGSGVAGAMGDPLRGRKVVRAVRGCRVAVRHRERLDVDRLLRSVCGAGAQLADSGTAGHETSLVGVAVSDSDQPWPPISGREWRAVGANFFCRIAVLPAEPSSASPPAAHSEPANRQA